MQTDDDLLIGARAIARNFFADQLSERQVYRLPEQGWPIFKLLNKLTCRPSAMREHAARLEAATTAERGAQSTAEADRAA
jgi:hypothetical protein